MSIPPMRSLRQKLQTARLPKTAAITCTKGPGLSITPGIAPATIAVALLAIPALEEGTLPELAESELGQG